MSKIITAVHNHQQALQACRRCPEMLGPVITGQAIASKMLLVGQAPGAREGNLGKPFAWTAGKTLFQWFSKIGLPEQAFRQRVYMAAVCRCFPGKKSTGGDRVPNAEEIGNCAPWLAEEIRILQPTLIVPVGKLAIGQFMPIQKLTQVIGTVQQLHSHGTYYDLIALPHPSGASTWHRKEPGRELLNHALALIQHHPTWQAIAEEYGKTGAITLPQSSKR